jgi:ferredoxin
MEEDLPKTEELLRIDYNPPQTDWMDTPADFRKGTWNYSASPKHAEYLGLPQVRKWYPDEEDWNLPENWREIILEGMRVRLKRFRTFQIFMDICVRCGACADKCHFFIGSGDPKNMPVLRAELLRSVYRREFTKAGRRS